jgi:hypothetical protein
MHTPKASHASKEREEKQENFARHGQFSIATQSCFLFSAIKDKPYRLKKTFLPFQRKRREFKRKGRVQLL